MIAAARVRDRRPRRLLVLAGLAEAAELLRGLGPLARLVVALDPASGEIGPEAAPAGAETRGGFRSAAALMTALKWDRIEAVVDAGHPFAAETSAQAALACRALGLPLVQLRRPGFPAAALGPDPRRCADVAAAAEALPLTARAFLDLPLDRLAPFAERRGAWFLVRTPRPQPGRFPLARGDYSVAAPPYSAAHEAILFADYRIDTLVLGDVGGRRALPTLAAARGRGARLLVVTPPEPPAPPPNGVRVATVGAALAALGLAAPDGAAHD